MVLRKYRMRVVKKNTFPPMENFFFFLKDGVMIVTKINSCNSPSTKNNSQLCSFKPLAKCVVSNECKYMQSSKIYSSQLRYDCGDKKLNIFFFLNPFRFWIQIRRMHDSWKKNSDKNDISFFVMVIPNKIKKICTKLYSFSSTCFTRIRTLNWGS